MYGLHLSVDLECALLVVGLKLKDNLNEWLNFWPPLTPNTLSKLIFYLLKNLNGFLIYIKFYTKVYPQIKNNLKKVKVGTNIST